MSNLEDFRGQILDDEDFEEVEEVEDISIILESQTDIQNDIISNGEKLDLVLDALDVASESSAATLAAADLQEALTPIYTKLDTLINFISILVVLYIVTFASSWFRSYLQNARFRK